jgi:hydrogenase nickel incorporation protein HypA/HybF
MHEISIMQNALELAEKHALSAGATSISSISLRVGAGSGVVPEALEFAFGVLKKQTLAASASLHIERVPTEFRCSHCGALSHLHEIRFDCPECNGLLIMGDGGNDLELSHLEVS